MWLGIEFDLDNVPISIVCKFDKYRINLLKLEREQASTRRPPIAAGDHNTSHFFLKSAYKKLRLPDKKHDGFKHGADSRLII